MPKLIFLALLLGWVISPNLMAQKTGTKTFFVNATYTRLPEIGFDPAFATYQVEVNGDESLLLSYGYSLYNIRKNTILDNYTLVPGGASILIQINVGTPDAGKAILNKQENTDKTGYKHITYSYTHQLQVSSSYRISDFQGHVVTELPLITNDKVTTQSFSSETQLKEYYGKAFLDILSARMKSLLSANINSIRSAINVNYGFTTANHSVGFRTMQEKDHPDQALYDKMQYKVEYAFKEMLPFNASKYGRLIQPVIDFWIEEEKKYDPLNKDQRKMNYALRSNLALAFYWKDDFESSKKYVDMMIKDDYHDTEAQNFLQSIQAIERQLAKLKIKGQHVWLTPSAEEKARSAEFVQARELLYASGDIIHFEQFNDVMGVNADSRTEPATLFYKTGLKESGYLVYESQESWPNFYYPSTYRFGKAKGKEIEVRAINYVLLDSLQVGDQHYIVQHLTAQSGAFKLIMENALVRFLQAFDRTQAFMVYPTEHYKGWLGGVGDNPSPKLTIYFKEKNEYWIPDELLGFSRGLSKILDDCAPAVEFLSGRVIFGLPVNDRQEDINVNTERMLNALRLYDDCK